ncbi:MAG: hypothetical protein H0U98_14320 [Alphaproteobacteria bacterium]|nr:hypothetical protein [Alphaproteobacteria bacterium]
MERYFFHVHQGGRTISDPDGSLCEGAPAALLEAVDTVKDLAHRAIENGVPSTALWVEIIGEDGIRIAALTVAEVLEHPDNPTFRDTCEN